MMDPAMLKQVEQIFPNIYQHLAEVYGPKLAEAMKAQAHGQGQLKPAGAASMNPGAPQLNSMLSQAKGAPPPLPQMMSSAGGQK